MAVSIAGVRDPVVRDSKIRYREHLNAGLINLPTEEDFIANEQALAKDLKTSVDRFSPVEVMFCIARLQHINPSDAHSWYLSRMINGIPAVNINLFYDGVFFDYQTGYVPGILRNPSLIAATQQIPITFSLKSELLNSLVMQCRSAKQQLAMSGNDKSATRKKGLSCFDKFEERSKEDCIWAAEKLVKYIFARYHNCQASVLCTYHDIMSGNLSHEESVAALQSMELLWRIDPTERELFVLKFRPQLAQRKSRKKKKEANRVALNTTITEERKTQLEELSEIKGKPLYKVLEELIYHAYKECKR